MQKLSNGLCPSTTEACSATGGWWVAQACRVIGGLQGRLPGGPAAQGAPPGAEGVEFWRIGPAGYEAAAH